jgi:hypothetical protein
MQDILQSNLRKKLLLACSFGLAAFPPCIPKHGLSKNASFLLYPHAPDKLSGIFQDFFTVHLPLAESIGEIMSRPHDALIQPYSGHESRQSLEIYSRLSLGEAQPVYEQAMERFPIP